MGFMIILFLNFVPCIGITYIKLMSSRIFSWCSKNSLCKSLFSVCTRLFVTITCQFPFRNNSSSNGRVLKFFDTFKKYNSSSVERVIDKIVYIYIYGLKLFLERFCLAATLSPLFYHENCDERYEVSQYCL